MLRLLLDEHLSPVLAVQLSSLHPSLEVTAVRDWERGAFRGAPDPDLLAAAHVQGLTLVTYDRRTIAPLLKEWAEAGASHGGVIFVDERTLAPNDIGGLLRALVQVWQRLGSLDWTDRVLYLTRGDR